MFVPPGAQAKLRQRRGDQFTEQFLQPLLAEAAKLGIHPGELKTMIDRYEETR